jgi:hypothetical protein
VPLVPDKKQELTKPIEPSMKDDKRPEESLISGVNPVKALLSDL